MRYMYISRFEVVNLFLDVLLVADRGLFFLQKVVIWIFENVFTF